MTQAHTISDQVADYLASGGLIRRFPRGFSNDWLYIQNKLLELGYSLKISGNGGYTIRRIGAVAKPHRLNRERALRRIDEILAEHGYEPYRPQTLGM